MADNYTFPGGVNTYVPQLHADLIVEYSRSPDKFPINKYVDFHKVDKQKGLYVQMQNSSQGRVVNDTDNVWPDGADTPTTISGTDPFEFKQFNCVRRRLPRMLGHLAVEQAGWDILDQEARLLAMQMMTARCKRIHSTLTTSGNWGGNYATATTAGGGTWANATGTNPYIRKSVAYAQIAIEQATYGTVMADELFMVVNPNTAKTIATSQEIIDYLKEQPSSIQLWEGQDQFRRYGLPEFLLGCRVIVDNTVYNSIIPQVGNNANTSFNFSLPDNFAVFLSKPKSIQASASAAFSTFKLFVFEEFVTEVFNDVEHRRYKVFVTENVDDSFLFAPGSGYLISTNT